MEGVGSQETMLPPEGATTPKREPLDRIRPLREPTRPDLTGGSCENKHRNPALFLPVLPIVQTNLEAKGQGLPPDTEVRWIMMRAGLHRETGHIQNLEAEGKTKSGSQHGTDSNQPGETQESIIKGRFAESILRLPTSTKKFGHYSVGNRRHII